MVKRLNTWPKLLSEYMQGRQNMPFAWGSNDCMAFVAYAVEALTGEQLFAEYGGYTDEAEANAMLEANGGIEGILTVVLGQPSTRGMMAKRGDVVLLNLPNPTAGIVDDTGQRIALVSKSGLLRCKLEKAKLSWSY